ncbi:hypothetical protein P775_28400 [Puniceibacterium antarcticum]|uniref:histidine kinase n=1 Tax=Puniceibacterium antarcticum TaxID=1206336 RepID=A0A2G8QU53_9RHOB|nr:ATP-binding protein [Puniceibacterium antarcticum]PIL12428.1 hypothetical protein P775_28400 [Puniceibacterium antarcticum]
MFQWLKRYMPRGIYARGLLILALPVVTLLLVVSVVFIQRHFEDVSAQMSRDLSRAVNLSLSVRDTPAGGVVERGLSLRIAPVSDGRAPSEDQRRFYDFSGLVVTRTFHEFVTGLQAVDLPNDKDVILYVRNAGQMYEVRLDRGRASPSNPHQLLVNMLFFSVVMTFISFLYLRNQLRPIARLAEAAEAFGKGRHAPYRPAGAVEVRAAGMAFVDMRARIERQIEQRTMMLSGVSHDLRTPLTRLKLSLAMLDDPEREPMERDVEDMQRLVDAFLEFARGNAEAGPAEPTDVQDFVAQLVQDAQRGGADVTLIKTSGSGMVTLRPTAMRRAVENLIGNAVRYGTRCEVSVMLTDGSMRIRIEDDGPGIAPERREEAMRPFVRLDESRNQNAGSGVGLGLAIAADIARAHGGVLRLGQSDSLGGLRADLVMAR